MVQRNSRREFLKAGVVTGATGFVSSATAAGQEGGSNTFRGKVVTPVGGPVSGAEVTVYDADAHAGQPVASTTTAQDGGFALDSFTPPQNPFLVVRDGGTGLFRVISGLNPENLRGSTEITVDSQLLYGPTIADANTSLRRGIVSVWREFRAGNQVLNFEVTATSRGGSPWGNLDEYGIREVSFSFSLPESVYIDYENTVLLFAHPNAPKRDVNPVSYVGKWYPSRVGLPLRYSAVNSFNVYEELDEERIRQETNTSQLGEMLTSTVLGEIPGYSLVTGLAQVYNIVSDNQGSSPVQVAGSDVETRDPNEFDTVSGVQPVFSISTVFQVPIQFSDESQGEQWISAQANWSTIQSIEPGHGNSFRFSNEFSVLPDLGSTGSGDGGDSSDENRGGGGVVVNSLSNGGSVEVLPDTWKGNPDNIVDGDPETKWQAAGNPDSIEVFFSLPQIARITGDYIRIGTGGNRDITRYEVETRGESQQRQVVEESVTGDGSPDATHSFSSPIEGSEIALRISDYQAPELCYSSCGVPIWEYELRGQYIDSYS